MSKEKPQTNESEDLTIAMTQFYTKRKVNNRAIKLTEKVCLGFLHTSFFPGTACVETTVIPVSYHTSEILLTFYATAYVYPRMPLSQVRYYHLFGA